MSERALLQRMSFLLGGKLIAKVISYRTMGEAGAQSMIRHVRFKGVPRIWAAKKKAGKGGSRLPTSPFEQLSSPSKRRGCLLVGRRVGTADRTNGGA